MSDASVVEYKDTNFADASQRFLLVMIWKLVDKDEDAQDKVGGVTLKEILNANPSTDPTVFKNIYLRMLGAFGETQSDGTKNLSLQLKYSNFFYNFIYDANRPAFKLSHLDFCIVTANNIWNHGNYDKARSYLTDPRSPIAFLCDTLKKGQNNKRYKNIYTIGTSRDVAKCSGSFHVEFTDDMPIDSSIEAQLTIVNTLRNAVKTQLQPQPIKQKIIDQSAQLLDHEEPDRPPRLPSSIERVLVDILYFVVLSGGGILSFAALNAALNFHVAKLILPNLNYGLNLGLGIAGGIAALASIAIFSIRILNTREKKQNELREKMKEAKGFERFKLRVVGVYKSPEPKDSSKIEDKSI
jgi:hypothetical protein